AWASAGEVLQSRLTPKTTLASYESRVSNAKACTTPEAFRTLRAAPKGVMLNQFSIGANVLVWSDHSVLAGPYHRDVTGTMIMINALRSTPEAAHDIVATSAADYVLVCPDLPETAFYASHAPKGTAPEATLSYQLGKGVHPDWLAPVAIDGPLKLYRVIR